MSKPNAPSVDDVIYAIRAHVRQQGLTRYTVAKMIGKPDTALRDFWKPEWCPGADMLRLLYALLPPGFDPATVPPESALPARQGSKREWQKARDAEKAAKAAAEAARQRAITEAALRRQFS